MDAFELYQSEPTIDAKADIEAEILRRNIILTACEQSDELKQFFIAECTKNPWFFMTNFLWINRPDLNGLSPFLAWPFHKELVDIYCGLNGWRTPSDKLYGLAIYKSRAMGGSVCLLGASLHNWLFGENSSDYLISQAQDKVDDNSGNFDNSLFGKLRFYIQHLPKWLRPKPWQKEDKPRKYDKLMNLENPERQTYLHGFCATKDAGRGARGRRVLIDEANFITHLEDLMGSATQIGPVALLSSVKGNSTYFARYVSGDVAQVATGKGEVGIVVRKLHYSQRPDWNQGTDIGRKRIADLRAVDSEENWQSEMECNFQADIVQGPKVWEHSFKDEFILSDEKSRSHLGSRFTIGAFDFGQSFAQTPYVFAVYLPKTDQIVFYNYFNFTAETCSEIEAVIKGAGLVPKILIGDGNTSGGPKTRNGVRRAISDNWFDNFENEVGWQIEKVNCSRADKDIKIINMVEQKLKAGKLLFGSATNKTKKLQYDKVQHPSLVQAIKGYQWDAKADEVANLSAEAAKPKKNQFSHLADALKLIVYAIYRQDVFGLGLEE